MRKFRMVGATFGALILASLAFASPAQATDPEPPAVPAVPSVTETLTECGVDLTFTNPTNWLFSFDLRADGQKGTPDEWTRQEIKEGPLAGKKFGQRYQEVTLQGPEEAQKIVPIAFDTAGKHTVKYRLARGAEQHLYFGWRTVKLDVPESCVPVVPSPDPSTSPMPEPSEPGDDNGTGGGDGKDDGTLPVTGASLPLVAGAGGLLVAAGVGLMLLMRNRRQQFTA